jgi:hypothetical protein
MMAYVRTVMKKMKRTPASPIYGTTSGTTKETPMTDEELELERSVTKYLQMQRDIFIICSRHGGSITGGPRTERRNEAVGGHENSWHLWRRGGLGVDIAFDDREGRLAAIAAFERMDYQVILYVYHIHVEPIG